jgi:molecular chaperone GrpE
MENPKDQKPVKKDKKSVKILEIERDDYKDKWVRTLAEFENFRRNTQKDKLDFIKYAGEKIILEVCEVLDNFEKALATEVTEENYKSYAKGIELIFQQLNSVLKKNDVIKIDALGKEFDPNYHEAISSIPALEPENTIVAVVSSGYMMGEKVIRASRVAVSSGNNEE